MENWKKILQPELWRDAFSLPGKSGTEKLCLFLRAYLGKIRRLGANLPLFGKSEHFNKVLGELATKFVLEEADCPACGESDGVNAITLENGFGLRRCRKCGLLYTSPRWRKDQVLPDLRAAGNKAEKILLAHKRVSKIEQLKKPGKILDAACDDGEFLEVAHDSGYAACGVKSPGLLKTGAEDFHGTGFDVIVLFDALAHSDNPRAELAALGERLTPDGIVVLSLPNAGSEQASADIASWPLLMPWKNRGHYDYDSLEKLVDGCGFEIIDVDTELSSGVGEVGVFLVALRRKEFEPNGRIFLRADAARGDTLFATPIIKGLKEKYPGCKITVATHFPELLGYFDDLDFVPATAPAPPEGVLRARYELLPQMHVIDALARLCRSGKPDRHLYYRVTEEEKAWAEKLLSGLRATGKTLAGIHALAGSRIKSWKRENWLALAKMLERENVSVVTLGANADSLALDVALNLCGKISLRESVAILQQLDLFVGLDSFLSHAAGAVCTPRVILYGSTDPERLLCDADVCPSEILRGECEFPGCRQNCLPDQWLRNISCRQQNLRCMESITPELVREKCLRLISPM
jgi:ADP-heptose:LPS heptosyltransferase/Zn ribbon nucleic-acid-binding protein